MQPSLLETRPSFDGPDLVPADQGRLTGQLARVRDLLVDGRPRTLRQIAQFVGGSEAGISARTRDLKKWKFGAYDVRKKRIAGGVWAYWIEGGR